MSTLSMICLFFDIHKSLLAVTFLFRSTEINELVFDFTEFHKEL